MNLIDVTLVVELDENNDEKIQIKAEQESSWRNENEIAGQYGCKSEYKLIVWGFEYSNQPYAEIGDNRYSIYRTYQPKDSEKIELYLGSKVGVVNG